MNRILITCGILLVALHLAIPATSVAADAPAGGKKLFHVVSLKFKEGTSKEQIAEVEQAFAALKTQIPGVLTLDWGTNVSPEKRNAGFTHCFVLTFGSDTDRDAYLVHPAHKAFVKLAGAVLADVTVIDFWSQG